MINLNNLKKILDELKSGRTGVLATILKTRGSTPAGNLSKMFILEGGSEIIGTIGGGCVEAEIITESRNVYESGLTLRKDFSLTEDDLEGGLICGGNIDVFLEPAGENYIEIFEELLDRTLQGQDCLLVSEINERSVVKKYLLFNDNELPELIKIYSQESFSEIILKQKTITVIDNKKTIVVEPVKGVSRLILFGGGHVSKFISEFASRCGFAVTVTDDRQKYVSNNRFPEVDELICEAFDKVFEKLTINQKTYIVIVTRGHSYDEVVLERAINTDAGYIGMIGSRRKITSAYKNLLNKGTDKGVLKKIYAPLGLEIGAQSAETIALSITAELVKLRDTGHSEPAAHFKDTMAALIDKLS